MDFETILKLGSVATVILVILVYALIMPKSRYDSMGPFGKFLHNFFNLKKLIVESIMRFIYVCSTVACVGFGVCLLFGKTYSFFGSGKSTFGYGIALIILGPIVVRLIYELLMLMIIIAKNVIEINNTINNKKDGFISEPDSFLTEKFSAVAVSAAASATAAAAKAAEEAKAKAEEAKAEEAKAEEVKPEQVQAEAPGKICPNCGHKNGENGKFCVKCGTQL